MSNRILYSPGRIVFIQLILIIGFCVLIARLVYLQIYQDVFLADQVFERLDSNYSLLATRGKILDRNNKILALDVKSFSVGVDLSKFTNSQNQIDYLSKVIKKEPSQLYEILKKKQSGYLEISRNISIKEKELLQRKKIKGLYFRENLRRSYPEKEIISHIVGLTDIDRKGIQGTELIFQNELKGKEGSFEGIKGLKNLKLEGKRIDPQAGKNIKLTIDINIQSIVYHELDRAIKEYSAHSGSVVVIEPNSGEILAMVNYPSFNPLDRRNLDFSTLRNRAIFDVFEPGSVLKPLAMSAILESDPSLYSKKINTSPGWIDYEGFKTRDFKDYGLLTTSEIISFSSNVGMIELEQAKDKVMMGAERRSMVMTEDEKEKTAYHEAGHALVMLNVEGHEPLHKVTIIPRGRALGVTMWLPERDKLAQTRTELEALIASMFGGRVAEELIYGKKHITTGAGNDIQQATNLARRMVMEFGFSDKLGPLRYESNQEEVFLGHSVAQQRNISDETARIIDEEVRELVEQGEKTARSIIENKIKDLHKLAKGLLDYETLNADEISKILSNKDINKEDVKFDKDSINKSSDGKTKTSQDNIQKPSPNET